jgi:probable HAF family extracellular repeat protein
LLWKGGTITDLGNLGGTINNLAVGVNNQGQIVGKSGLPGDTTFHAFLWQNGAMIDLGTLPGDSSSNAFNIHSKGQVVGTSCDMDGNCRAFLWENDVMVDINTLIPAGSDLFLFEAVDVNSRGQIVGTAFQKRTGEIHPFARGQALADRRAAAGTARQQSYLNYKSSCIAPVFSKRI